MGCLNSNKNFEHWFANIHFSGPCNRACYFCIGQHMMALDPLNTLDTWPLPGFERFIDECKLHNISEVNLTGSNTDPLLYRHLPELKERLSKELPGLTLGLRTNGVLALHRPDLWALFDKASISITSTDPVHYQLTMGKGQPPNVYRIRQMVPDMPLKVNIVLCPVTVVAGDLMRTLENLSRFGITTVNLREPYGQPHIGDPMDQRYRVGDRFGMPRYEYAGMDVTYWDVHYVEVESVNLYSNGEVSTTYPVTKGHDPIEGKVEDQSHFPTSGRVSAQWLTYTLEDN